MALTAPAPARSPIDIWTLSAQGICDACLDGKYENCYCSTAGGESQSYSSSSRGNSLDMCSSLSSLAAGSPGSTRKELNSSGSYTHSIQGEFISDNEFEDFIDLEGTDILPAPTVDWDTIDSVLTDTTLVEHHGGEKDTSLTSTCSEQQLRGPRMQMVFVDSCESDKESIPDVEVYYEDDQDFLNRSSVSTCNLSTCGSERNLDSRDSGYITNDMYEMNIEYVTGDTKRRGSLEPAEIASRVLASLQLHEECEQKRKKYLEEKVEKKNDYMFKLNKKTMEELQILKENLELRIAEVNMDLVGQLSLRDELHSHHQALLMDADDIAKSAPSPSYHQNNNELETPTNSPVKKAAVVVVPVSPTKAKRRSFWFR